MAQQTSRSYISQFLQSWNLCNKCYLQEGCQLFATSVKVLRNLVTRFLILIILQSYTTTTMPVLNGLTTWLQRPPATLNSGKIWFLNGSSTRYFWLSTLPARLIRRTSSQKKCVTALIFDGFGTPSCLACLTSSKVLSWCFIMLVKLVSIKLFQLLLKWLCRLVLHLTSQLLLHPGSVGISPRSQMIFHLSSDGHQILWRLHGFFPSALI